MNRTWPRSAIREQDFHRSMSLWSNMALGFTYLSPLVGVYSLWAYSLALGGPPAVWWIIIVGCGQFLVALVFGEVVSQFPLAGGIYPMDQEAVGPQVRVDRELGVPVGGHRHRDGRRRIRRRLHRRALRNRAHPNRSVDHRGRFAAVRVGSQLQRYAHARQSCQDRVGGRVDRRDRTGVVFAHIQAGSTVFGLLRLNGCRWRHGLYRDLLRCGVERPLLVLRLRGVRQPRRGSGRPHAADPQGDDADHPHRRRLGIAVLYGVRVGRARPPGDRGRRGPRSHSRHSRELARNGRIQGLPVCCGACVRLLCAVPAGRGKPTALFVRPGPHAADERVAVAHVGKARRTQQRAPGRMRRAHPDLPVRLCVPESVAENHGIRRIWASTSRSSRSCSPLCGNA